MSFLPVPFTPVGGRAAADTAPPGPTPGWLGGGGRPSPRRGARPNPADAGVGVRTQVGVVAHRHRLVADQRGGWIEGDVAATASETAPGPLLQAEAVEPAADLHEREGGRCHPPHHWRRTIEPVVVHLQPPPP